MDLDFKDVTYDYILSANEIRQYTDCARKRYYSSRSCLSLASKKVSNSLVLGDLFHKFLAYQYVELNKLVNATYPNIDSNINSVEIETLYDMVPLWCPEELDKLSEDDQKVLNCLITNYKAQIIEDIIEYDIIEPELTFVLENWPVDKVLYHGFIDLVVKRRSDNKVYFFEHKTCKTFRPEIYNRFDIQLHIYSAYGKLTYGDDFGGMILNEVKKAKTATGFDVNRNIYEYTDKESQDFFNWIKGKTLGLMSNNSHEPCNNYMICKMCSFSDVCLRYGYEVPQSAEEILEVFKDEEGNDMYYLDLRKESNNEEE